MSKSLTLASGQPLYSVVHTAGATTELAPAQMDTPARIASVHQIFVSGPSPSTVSICHARFRMHQLFAHPYPNLRIYKSNGSCHACLAGGAHGVCQNGVCECEAGWAGDRCTQPPARRPLWETPPPPPPVAKPLTPDQLALLEKRQRELHGPKGATSAGGLKPSRHHAEAAAFDRFRKLHWGQRLRPVRGEL